MGPTGWAHANALNNNTVYRRSHDGNLSALAPQVASAPVPAQEAWQVPSGDKGAPAPWGQVPSLGASFGLEHLGAAVIAQGRCILVTGPADVPGRPRARCHLGAHEPVCPPLRTAAHKRRRRRAEAGERGWSTPPERLAVRPATRSWVSQDLVFYSRYGDVRWPPRPGRSPLARWRPGC